VSQEGDLPPSPEKEVHREKNNNREGRSSTEKEGSGVEGGTARCRRPLISSLSWKAMAGGGGVITRKSPEKGSKGARRKFPNP